MPRGGWAPSRRVTSGCDAAGTGLVHLPAERSPGAPTPPARLTAARAALIALGDQPKTPDPVVPALLAAFARAGKPIVVPVFKGTQGTPVVFAREVFPELHRLTGDAGARSVVNARPERVERVVFDLPMPPDVDTPEDYARLHVQ